MRINNHEHTDLQEYLGTYITDETGASTLYYNFLHTLLEGVFILYRFLGR
jgi:midasin (ATPase involved in ribosome maturation)